MFAVVLTDDDDDTRSGTERADCRPGTRMFSVADDTMMMREERPLPFFELFHVGRVLFGWILSRSQLGLSLLGIGACTQYNIV